MLDKIRRQEQLGQKGYADVIQAESDLADSEYELVNARNMSRDQLTILSDLMFWPDDRPLLIDTVLPLPDKLQDMAFESADAILENNPDYRIAAANLLNSQRELSTARWQLFPKLSLYAGWNTNYFTMDGSTTAPFAEQFRNNSGEYVQLSLSIPLFDRLQKHSTVARKRNALTVAQAEKEQKSREIEQEYRRATQDCEGAIEAYRQAAGKADIQEEAYRLNLKKLEQGLVSQLEFRAINDALLKSKADLMNSLFKLLIKQSVVRYYEGVDYIDQN
jgi:outer membrane protein TolC